MRLPVVLTTLGVLLGCAGEVNFVPDGGADTAREGLTFPDQGGVDAEGGATTDGPDGAPASDGPRDGSRPEIVFSPDLPADLSAEDSAPSTCDNFSRFTCQSIPPVIDCSSMCTTGGAQLGIACYATGDCACVKNLTTVGTCPKSGSGCSACASAFPCCAAKF
jgi:hypothetical protein